MANSITDSINLQNKVESEFSKFDMNDAIDPHRASVIYKKIMEMVHDFESQLDDEHEIAVKLASFGTSILLYITDIGYYNTDLICFYGYVNGHYSQLVQHVSQINFLLTSVDKPAEAQHARRIGFEAPQDE